MLKTDFIGFCGFFFLAKIKNVVNLWTIDKLEKILIYCNTVIGSLLHLLVGELIYSSMWFKFRAFDLMWFLMLNDKM